MLIRRAAEAPTRHHVVVGTSPFATASTKGRVLVAVPLLDEPTFHRTVIYMLQHNEDGAFGLVINKPTNETHVRGLDPWMHHLSEPQVVFDGGPVSDDTLIALAALALPAGDEGFTQLDNGISTVDLSTLPDELAESLHHLRVFRGYSGWSPGQLDDELSEGAWLVLPYTPGDLFSHEPNELWRRVLRRAGGPKALLAEAPEQLEWN
jgi:putative transcriptional regulator